MKARFLKIRAAVIFAAAVFTLLLPGCSKKRTSLTVGFDSEFPPFSYVMEDGSYEGFDIEFAKAVCEMEGWEIELIPISWDEKDSLLNDGSIDCIWCGFTINGREDDYTVTMPYCSNRYVVVVSSDSPVKDFDGLAGKTVGVQAASSGAEYLTENEEGKALNSTFKLLSQFTDFGAAFQALEDGTLDAVISDIGIANHYTTGDHDGLFRILPGSMTEEQYGVAVAKGDTELCETLNADIEKLLNNGWLYELGQKYGIEDEIWSGNS